MFNRQARPGALINITDNFIQLARLVRLDEKPLEIDALAEIETGNEEAFSLWLDTHFKDFVGRGYLPTYCGFHPTQRVLARENLNARRFTEPNYLPPLFIEHAKVASMKEWHLAALHPSEGTTPVADGVIRPGLLLGVPWSAVRDRQDWLLNFGLRPRRLQVGTVSMLGSLCRRLSVTGNASAIAVCEVEYSQTRLYVVAKDGVHTLPALPHGLLSILETGMKEVGAPDVAATRTQLENPPEALRVHDRRIVRALSRHLKPALDHFELRTGQRIEFFHCTQLPAKLQWLAESLCGAVELEMLPADYAPWLTADGLAVKPGDVKLNSSWLATFSLVSELAPLGNG